MQSGGGAHDIDDGVKGADFMETDLFNGTTVDGGLGVGQALEDGESRGFDSVVKRGVNDDAMDIGKGAMVVILADFDDDAGGAYSPAGDRLGADVSAADTDGVDGGGDGLQRHAKVDKGAKEHVSGNSERGVAV